MTDHFAKAEELLTSPPVTTDPTLAISRANVARAHVHAQLAIAQAINATNSPYIDDYDPTEYARSPHTGDYLPVHTAQTTGDHL